MPLAVRTGRNGIAILNWCNAPVGHAGSDCEAHARGVYVGPLPSPEGLDQCLRMRAFPSNRLCSVKPASNLRKRRILRANVGSQSSGSCVSHVGIRVSVFCYLTGAFALSCSTAHSLMWSRSWYVLPATLATYLVLVSRLSKSKIAWLLYQCARFLSTVCDLPCRWPSCCRLWGCVQCRRLLRGIAELCHEHRARVSLTGIQVKLRQHLEHSFRGIRRCSLRLDSPWTCF